MKIKQQKPSNLSNNDTTLKNNKNVKSSVFRIKKKGEREVMSEESSKEGRHTNLVSEQSSGS